MLDFPSDFTHSHHIPMRENKYDFYFTNERLPPKQNDFSEESDWNTPFLIGLSQFSFQSLLE